MKKIFVINGPNLDMLGVRERKKRAMPLSFRSITERAK